MKSDINSPGDWRRLRKSQRRLKMGCWCRKMSSMTSIQDFLPGLWLGRFAEKLMAQHKDWDLLVVPRRWQDACWRPERSGERPLSIRIRFKVFPNFIWGYGTGCWLSIGIWGWPSCLGHYLVVIYFDFIVVVAELLEPCFVVLGRIRVGFSTNATNTVRRFEESWDSYTCKWTPPSRASTSWPLNLERYRKKGLMRKFSFICIMLAWYKIGLLGIVTSQMVYFMAR